MSRDLKFASMDQPSERATQAFTPISQHVGPGVTALTSGQNGNKIRHGGPLRANRRAPISGQFVWVAPIRLARPVPRGAPARLGRRGQGSLIW